MPISSEAFRMAMRHFASGVTIVTLRAGQVIHGLTVSAFASVSPDPPLVMVAIDHEHSAFPLLERPDAVFAVNILRRMRSSCPTVSPGSRTDRFKGGVDDRRDRRAYPVDALAWLDCTICALPGRSLPDLRGRSTGQRHAALRASPLVWNQGYRALAQRDPLCWRRGSECAG